MASRHLDSKVHKLVLHVSCQVRSSAAKVADSLAYLPAFLGGKSSPPKIRRLHGRDHVRVDVRAVRVVVGVGLQGKPPFGGWHSAGHPTIMQ